MRERIRFESEIAMTLALAEQEILPVDRREEQIDNFLHREKDLPRWRISQLLKCKAVELLRDGNRTPLTKETDKIKRGDQIDLQSPLKSSCQTAIDNIPETEYRDYAFANPKPADDYEKFLLEYLKLKPQVTVLSSSSVDSLSSFKRALAKGDLIKHPIRNLILASHAGRMGLLALPLTTGSLKVLTFEDLVDAVKFKTLELDPTLLEPRPKDASKNKIPAHVHIKGCNIGNAMALPFLKELKKAFGGGFRVTAPKFFHSMKPVHFSTRRGGRLVSRKLVEIWEFFSYEFVLFRTSKLANKVDAVAAFDAATKVDPTLIRIDGTPVPKTDWERWIPRTLPAENKIGSVEIPVGTTLSTNSKSADAQFRYRKAFFQGKEWHALSVASDPGSDALRKDEIKKRLLASDPRFQSSHAYPFYTRTGFKSIDDYFDSFDWRFKKFDAKKQTLAFSGTRHEYTVLAPIVDPKTNELFMNLFPVSGTPTIKLLETDTRFFTTV